jgi:hypothetical protein
MVVSSGFKKLSKNLLESFKDFSGPTGYLEMVLQKREEELSVGDSRTVSDPGTTTSC